MSLDNKVRKLIFSLVIFCSATLFAQTPLTGDITIGKTEKKEIPAGSTIGTLTILGDNTSCGQVTVASGIVDIDKMVYKYSFVPNEWIFVSFPIDANLRTISNLSDLGYTLATGDKSYQLKYFSSKAKSKNEEPWIEVRNNPSLKAFKGYMIRLNGSGTTPVEVTFTLDDIHLDTESSAKLLYLSLDLSNQEVGTEKMVYITPKNIKGNVLRVNVSYSPSATSELPLNYESALKEARFIRTLGGKGLRISLPNAEKAKVVFMNKKGTKVVKCVDYISPAVIDISKMKNRTYQVILKYGNAVTVKEFKK